MGGDPERGGAWLLPQVFLDARSPAEIQLHVSRGDGLLAEGPVRSELDRGEGPLPVAVGEDGPCVQPLIRPREGQVAPCPRFPVHGAFTRGPAGLGWRPRPHGPEGGRPQGRPVLLRCLRQPVLVLRVHQAHEDELPQKGTPLLALGGGALGGGRPGRGLRAHQEERLGRLPGGGRRRRLVQLALRTRRHVGEGGRPGEAAHRVHEQAEPGAGEATPL